MPLSSMTGYGRCVVDGDGTATAVEVRSVNNRSLKLISRLSDPVSPAAHRLEERVKERVSRGTVTVTVVHRPPPSEQSLKVSLEAMEGLWRQLDELRQRLGISQAVRIESLMALPGVMEDRRSLLGAEPDEAWAQIQDTVEKALDQLVEMRKIEGSTIEADLRQRAAVIRDLTARARARAPEVLKDHGQRLESRLEALLEKSGVEASQADVLRELAIHAERVDFSEELQRLDSHVAQFEAALESDACVGRKLEFVAQEMLRESNTIGSKCHDGEVAKLVVALKLEVERIREQVLNVE